LDLIREKCGELGVRAILSEVWEKGGAGGAELARAVVRLTEAGGAGFRFAYPDEMPIRQKIETVAREIYGAEGADFLPAASKEIRRIETLGFGKLPVCVAKTQYSLSDDQKKLGRPTGFRIMVRNAKVSAGAGFVVALTGEIMTMPGLPRVPAAESVDADSAGRITGLF
jgi:formate--tetrahydrofolate ligase